MPALAVVLARAPRLVIAVLVAGIAAPATAQTLEGRWEGALRFGDVSLRMILDVAVADDDLHLGTLTSLDQGNAELPVDVMEVDGDRVSFEIRTIGARYDGTLDGDRVRLTGSWDQGVPLALEFTRVARPARTTATQGRDPDTQASASEPFPEPFGVPLQLEVPFAAPSFAAGGRTHFAYELHLSNFGFTPAAIRRIEVLDVGREGSGRVLASFERAELNALLRLTGAMPAPGSGARVTDLRRIPPGRRSIAFMWLTLGDDAALPMQLRHRVTIRDQAVEGAEVQLDERQAIVVGAPLTGGNWLAVNGPGNASIHRRAVLTLEGRARIAQRFAVDWVQLDERGRTFSANPEENASYYAYGADVLAVADAVVAAVDDGIPENVPGLTSRAVPITLETLAGNQIVLDLGDGRFAFYAHLQPGSLRVQPGERVARGQVIASLGNSGNSTEPHLHFHIADGPTLASEGVPYAFERFELQDRDGRAQPRQAELPLQHAVVRFPDAR